MFQKGNQLGKLKRKYDLALIGTVCGACLRCGKPITFKYHHFRKGIPIYCWGHNPEPVEAIERKRVNYKGRALRPPWTDEQREAFSGDKNHRYGYTPTADHIENIKLGNAKLMSDPERKAKWLSAVLKGSHKRPNYREEVLDKRIQVVLPNEFKYTGNGEIVIGGRNPDWFNINGKKQVIELFGRHWHKPEDEQTKVEHYKKYGYDCLVIWVEELNDLNSVDMKLMNFK